MNSDAELFGRKKYGCGGCGASFKDLEELLTHADQMHDKKTNYLCLTCDEEFGNESSFKMHMAREHRI